MPNFSNYLQDSIVFADLELILLCLSTLERLRLEGGLDNVDQRDEVVSEVHGAKLKHLRIRSFHGRIGIRQLCWIVSPFSPNPNFHCPAWNVRRVHKLKINLFLRFDPLLARFNN